MPAPSHTSATALTTPALGVAAVVSGANGISGISALAIKAIVPMTNATPTPLTNAGSATKDVYYGGFGKIVGTTKVLGSPNFPVARRVRIFRDVDGQVVRGTWSDSNGDFVVKNLDPTIAYSAVAYDYLHTYRAVIADNLTPDAWDGS